MIVDPAVFELNHLPRRLLHRDREVGHLRDCLPPDPSGDILLHGPSGVGKTALARHVRRRIAETGTPTAYVRTMGQTPGQVTRSILDAVDGDPYQTMPTLDVVDALRDRVSPATPAVAVLDEADDLAGGDVLPLLDDVEGLHLVAVIHDRNGWLGHVDDHAVHTRLGSPDAALGLDRYGVDALADILQRRVDHGLRGSPVARKQLEYIADECAGVAREAVQVLRAAAELAEQRRHDRIRDGDIEDAWDRAERRILEAAIRSVTFHHQVLYEVVRQSDGLDGPAIYERYEAIAEDVYDETVADDPITERDCRRKLSKLGDYGLVEKEGEYGEYHAVDERVEGSVNLQPTPDI